MIWHRIAIVFAGIVAAASASGARANDLSVTGSVGADWSAARLVTPSPDAVLRPGHKLRITVTGQVDINFEQKHRRDCSWFGLSCKNIDWTEHHWNGPDSAPVLIQIRAIGSGQVIASQVVNAQFSGLTVPVDTTDFSKRYEVVASLAGVGTAIDPARSAGSYTVSLTIDATARADAFSSWLTGTKPTADLATSAEVLDQALLQSRPEQTAGALRSYAASRFPLANVALRSSYETLVRKAMEIAPGDPANAMALANFFRAVGLNAQADAVLNKVINDLEAKTDSHSRFLLAKAYVGRADAGLVASGGVSPTAVEDALAYYAKSIELFEAVGRRDFLSDTLVRRARLLRGTRTPAALADAIAAFQRARDLAPEMVRARGAFESPDGKSLQLLDWADGYRTPTLGAAADDSPWIADAVPLAWDAVDQKVLESRNGIAFQWRSLAPDAVAQPGPLLSRQRWGLEVAGGAAITINAGGTATHFAAKGTITPLSFKGAARCPEVILPPGLGRPTALTVQPFVLGSIARSGEVAATYCNDTLQIYKIVGGVPSLVQTVALPVAGGGNYGSLNIAAGPANCGVAVAKMENNGGPAIISVTLVRLDGGRVSLSLAAVPPAAPSTPFPSFGLPKMAYPTFTADGRILVVRSDMDAELFSCAGSAVGKIKIPPRSSKPQMPVEFLKMQWLDKDFLSVADFDGSRLLVMDTARAETNAYPVGMTDSVYASAPKMEFAFPGVTPGATPRVAKSARRAILRQLGEAVAVSQTVSFLPGTRFFESTLLNSGQTLLSSDLNFSESVVTDLATGRATPIGAALGRPFGIDGVDGWAAVRFGPAPSSGATPFFAFKPPVAIEIYRKAMLVQTATFGDLGAADRSRVAGAIAKIVHDNPPQAFPVPPGYPFFPPLDLHYLVESPDRLSLQRSLMTTTGPLASSGGRGAIGLCVSLLGRTQAGTVLPLPLSLPPGALPSELYSFRDGKPVLEKADAFDCMSATVVDGDKPTILTREPTTPQASQFRIKWLRNGAWIDGGIQPGIGMIGESSVMPDGSVLVLLNPSDSSGPGADLIRLLPGGGQRSACTACSGINVYAAATAISTRLRTGDQGRTEDGPVQIDTRNLVMVDREGKLLAKPDGDETVILSLDTGAELLRVRLGRVLVLRKNLVVVDTGEDKLQVHRL